MYAGGHKQDESMIAAACPGVPETADTFDSEANLTTPHFRTPLVLLRPWLCLYTTA